MLTACGESTQLHYTTPVVQLTASGPLTEGANTAQGEFSPDLTAFLAAKGFSITDIEHAALKSAQLTLPDSLDSDLLTEVTLQLAADQVDMQKVGVLNPVPANQTRLAFQVAQEQEEIGALLKQPKILLVADINIRQDTSTDWSAGAVLEFQLTLKK